MSKSKLTFNEILFLVIGCILMSVSLNMFFEPHSIAPGGLTGLAIVISSVFPVPLWAINLVFNIPLFMLAYRILSKKDCLKTILGIIFLTIGLKLTANLANINATSDPILAAICGSILMGISLGFIFTINGSTGGTDLIGLLANKFFPHLSVAVLMGMADFVVVVLSGVSSGQIEIALYSAVSLYAIVKITDIFIDGFDYSKSFTIISEKPHEISNAIMEELERGATFLKGEGAYTGDSKNIVFVVVSKKQVITLKRLVKNIDPDAFIIVTDIHEALGNGFKQMNS